MIDIKSNDQDVARLIKHDLVRSKMATGLDMTVISDIETILNEGKYLTTSTSGLVIIRYTQTGIVSETGTSEVHPDDRRKISEWVYLPQEKKLPFVSDMYRIDLSSHIFIFKEYNDGMGEMAIAGHLLYRSSIVRMELLNIKQEEMRYRICHQRREAI